MQLARVVPLTWRTARGSMHLDRPVLAGILNVTPDSFFDGGRHDNVAAAVQHAAHMLAEGADILDVGGESTRPGAGPVSAADEAARVIPVIRALVRAWPDAVISVDTVKGEVARAALAEGAAIINDVSGLRLDDTVATAVADAGAGIIVMHSRGDVDRMAHYDLATYGADVVADVASELHDSVTRARDGGIGADAIVIDPGLGFSKRTTHSVALLAQLDRLLALDCPIMVGPSRKRFVGEDLPVADRLEGTLAACVIALLHGARLFRVHDVAPARRALALAHAVLADERPS